MLIAAKERKDRNGIVIKPNHSMYFVVHEIPSVQGSAASGMIL